ILRHGKPGPARAGEQDAQRSPGDGLPVVSFYHGRKGLDPEEDERCRAVALMELTLRGDRAAARTLSRVLPVLAVAVRRDRDDGVGGEARGYALALQDQPAEALAAFQAVLSRAPDRELALVGAATAAEALDQTEAALGYWRRAVAANPSAAGYRHTLTLLLIQQEAWAEARAEAEAWGRLDPVSAEARAPRGAGLPAGGHPR